MIKKLISFIVILLAYSIICAAVVIGTSNFGLGFGQDGSTDITYSYAMDRAGDVYYIKDTEGEKSFVSVDSTGKKLFERKLSNEIFGDCFLIDNIYVEHDKSIYLTSYQYDPQTMFVTEVSVHQFYEDGSYVEKLFNESVLKRYDGCAHIISSFSEDNTNIYFSLLNNGKAEVFTIPKDNSKPVAKVKEYEVAEKEIYGFYTSSQNDVAIGRKGGITIYTANGKRNIENETAVFDRFWNGINLFYTLDSSTGNLYAVTEDYAMSSVLPGSRIINAEEELAPSDMSELAVSITGNLFASIHDVSERLYAGSFSVVTQIYTESVDRGLLLNSILALAGVAVGVIFISILTWDFYVSILKMRLSIFLRQSLLIAMMIFVSLYSLSVLIIIPQVKNIVTANYKHESQLIANSFLDGLMGSAASSGDTSFETYQNYLECFGMQASAADAENEFGGDDEKPSINLVELKNGKASVIASSEMLASGYPADRLIYFNNLSEVISSLDKEEVFISSYNDIGQYRIYLIRLISLPETSNKTALVVSTGIDGLETAVNDIQSMIDLFLVLGGVIMIIIFMVIESITARAVGKLKRSVDKITIGDYTTPINIHTGDEVEELAVSVKALSNHIVDKTTSLERLNNSYYRFVPLSFLNTLGETKIEKISKSLHAKRSMTVLFLRFTFSQRLTSMESEDIFSSINAVLEQVVPVVAENNGTAYNFMYNGFNAIFAESAENALLAAIKIREIIGVYNDLRLNKGKRTVDVRIVIDNDEVLLGFIGDEKRMEPTAVSTAINCSEEIEKLCVDSGLYIVCTEKAFEMLPPNKYCTRCIGNYCTADSGIRRLYDMYDSDPYALVKLKEQFLMRFDLGVKLFEKKDFVNARNMFMDIVKYAADDGVSRNYMYISEHNISYDNKLLTYEVYDSSVK